MSLKQLKMKFKPGIKLNHNIHIGSDVNVLPAFYSIFKCLKALARLATAYPFWEFLQFFFREHFRNFGANCGFLYWLKVIPLFCAAHPLLRITLPHPRWRRFFSVARKEQTRAAFAELKLLFTIIMPQIGRQLPGLLSKNKKRKEMCVIPKSAVVFHFPAVELWNY